jgi:hypothetical protein
MQFPRFPIGALLLACSCSGAAQTAVSTVTLDTAQSQLAIEPGAEGRLVFDVRTFTAGPATVSGFLSGERAWFDEYVFEPLPPSQCAAPVVTMPGVLERVEFDVGPLDAGATVRCAYRVVRRADSRHDTAFHLCPPGQFPVCGLTVQVGTLPDLALAAVPADGSGLVRVSVTNHSARDVTDVTLETDCTEFDGGFFDPAPFDVVGDVPDGCPIAAAKSGCLNFTGQVFDTRAFAVGPVPAGGTRSCLLRLAPFTDGRAAARTSLPIGLRGAWSLFGTLVPLDGDASGFDASAGNNRAVLGVQGGNAIPIGAAALVLIAVGVFALAFPAFRRRVTPT